MNFVEIEKLNEDISITRKYLGNCYDLLFFMKKMSKKKILTKEDRGKFVEVKLHFEMLDLNMSYFKFLLKSTIFEKVKALSKCYFDRDEQSLDVLEEEFYKEFRRLKSSWKNTVLN